MSDQKFDDEARVTKHEKFSRKSTLSVLKRIPTFTKKLMKSTTDAADTLEK